MYSLMKVMKERVLFVLTAIILSIAFISTASAKTTFEIEGEYDEVASKVIITIEGTEVINGHVSQWDGTGELYGEYMGQEVFVSCDYVITSRDETREVCEVFIDEDFEELIMMEE